MYNKNILNKDIHVAVVGDKKRNVRDKRGTVVEDKNGSSLS